MEVKTAAELVEEAADSDANIIIGAIIDENLGDELVITVIATGFKGNVPGQPEKEEETNPFSSFLNGMGNLSSTQSAPSYNQAPGHSRRLVIRLPVRHLTGSVIQFIQQGWRRRRDRCSGILRRKDK